RDFLVTGVQTCALPIFLVPAVTCLGILSLSAPAVVGNLARPEAAAAVPAYWKQAAEWLDEQPEQGAVLMLPSAAFADFEWGSTKIGRASCREREWSGGV